MKLENILSSQKSGNNKEGFGYSHANAKSQLNPIFVKATNQKSSFNCASPSKSKTFIDRTPHKPKATKNVQ